MECKVHQLVREWQRLSGTRNRREKIQTACGHLSSHGGVAQRIRLGNLLDTHSAVCANLSARPKSGDSDTPPREVSLVGQSPMPEKLADGDYGALLRCDWRRSPDGTESEWLPFTLDNSMLTPCSGGSERHRFACCSHADLRQWIAGRDKWERLSSTGGENCGQQGIRDFKDLVPPVAPTGTPGVNGQSGWKGLACFCSGP
jgi:hypothetical protein